LVFFSINYFVLHCSLHQYLTHPSQRNFIFVDFFGDAFHESPIGKSNDIVHGFLLLFSLPSSLFSLTYA